MSESNVCELAKFLGVSTNNVMSLIDMGKNIYELANFLQVPTSSIRYVTDPGIVKHIRLENESMSLLISKYSISLSPLQINGKGLYIKTQPPILTKNYIYAKVNPTMGQKADYIWITHDHNVAITYINQDDEIITTFHSFKNPILIDRISRSALIRQCKIISEV